MITQLIKQFGIMAPLMQAVAGKGAGDRMQMMQQLQQSMMNDPNFRRHKNQGVDRQAIVAQRAQERMQKDREKQLRQLKRKQK